MVLFFIIRVCQTLWRLDILTLSVVLARLRPHSVGAPLNIVRLSHRHGGKVILGYLLTGDWVVAGR